MIYLTILIILILVIGCLLARHYEKRDWNRGVCTCGKGWWQSFDTDSQGGRGYKCTACARHIWISYAIDR